MSAYGPHPSGAMFEFCPKVRTKGDVDFNRRLSSKDAESPNFLYAASPMLFGYERRASAVLTRERRRGDRIAILLLRCMSLLLAPKRTSERQQLMSVIGGKADIDRASRNVRSARGRSCARANTEFQKLLSYASPHEYARKSGVTGDRNRRPLKGVFMSSRHVEAT
jgi:hypothetical protein